MSSTHQAQALHNKHARWPPPPQHIRQQRWEPRVCKLPAARSGCLPLVLMANPPAGVMPGAAHEQRAGGDGGSSLLPPLPVPTSGAVLGRLPFCDAAADLASLSARPAGGTRAGQRLRRSKGPLLRLPTARTPGRHTASRSARGRREQKGRRLLRFPFPAGAGWRCLGGREAGAVAARGLARRYVQSPPHALSLAGGKAGLFNGSSRALGPGDAFRQSPSAALTRPAVPAAGALSGERLTLQLHFLPPVAFFAGWAGPRLASSMAGPPQPLPLRLLPHRPSPTAGGEGMPECLA